MVKLPNEMNITVTVGETMSLDRVGSTGYV